MINVYCKRKVRMFSKTPSLFIFVHIVLIRVGGTKDANMVQIMSDLLSKCIGPSVALDAAVLAELQYVRVNCSRKKKGKNE